jgi:uncharacterized lipoprotein YmbA
MRDTFLCLIGAGALFCLSILTACTPFGRGTTSTTRFYVLSSLYSTEAQVQPVAKLAGLNIAVGPIRLPEHLDRPQIVTRGNQNEIQVVDFAQWGESLRNNFTRVLAENLSVLLATENIAMFPFLKTMPVDYQITADVIRFDGNPGEDARLRVRWAIFDRGGKNLSYRASSAYSEPTRSDEIPELIAAKSRSLVVLSREIAKAITALSQGRKPE